MKQPHYFFIKMKKNDLLAHIKLLDDPDLKIYETISNNLINEGVELIPFLEIQWELQNNELVQERLENIISEIQFREIKKELTAWVESGGEDIIQGAYIVAKQNYPNLDIEDINTKVQQIYNEAWLEMHDNLTALEKIRIINHILFSSHKFRGKLSFFKDIKSSYLNIVFATKKGSPIMLSIIYMAIAQRLKIPVQGVNLYNNFILAYVDPVAAKIAYPEKNDDVLFYINPFNRGSVFEHKEIDKYLEQQKVEKHKNNYTPISNIKTIQVLILELIKISKTTENKPKFIERLRELYSITVKK